MLRMNSWDAAGGSNLGAEGVVSEAGTIGAKNYRLYRMPAGAPI